MTSLGFKGAVLGNGSAAEPSVVKDPKTGELVSSVEEIKRVSLSYCCDLLTNRLPRTDFIVEIELKSLLHEVRYNEVSEDDIQLLTIDQFHDTILALSKKPGSKYDFITKAGKSLHGALYRLCQAVWSSEQIPETWKRSRLIQAYKGKGDKSCLDNFRHLHIKEEIPKIFGHFVMSKAKDSLISNMSKFQIGAKPGHMAQEHLFVMKSVLSLQIDLGEPVFLSMWDVSKFFDRESLRDCMSEVYNNQVRGKLYRLIFNMNNDTRISVQTPVGVTDECKIGESVGQGTLEGAIISAVNLDNGVKNFFSNSDDEMNYLGMKLGPLLFQDDVGRLANSISSVQSGNCRMEAMAESKLLDYNLSKSCFMVFSDTKKLADIEADLNLNPIILCGKPMERVKEAKYLGDWLNCLGLDASVQLTVNKRKSHVLRSAQDIRKIVDDHRCNALGGLVVGLDIWEMAVMPMLIYNAETWLGVSSKTISDIELLQRQFLRILLGAAPGTPTPALYWETGTLLIKYRILLKKLLFIHHLETLPNNSLAYEVYQLQKSLNLPGLYSECGEVLSSLDMENPGSYSRSQWKSIIKKEIYSKNMRELIDESAKYKKIEYSLSDSFVRQNYLSELKVTDARLMFKLRTKMTPTVQMNFVSDDTFKKNFWTCSGCSEPNNTALQLQGKRDTQSHILYCPGYSDLRTGLNLEWDADLVQYFKNAIRHRMNLQC